MKTKFKFVDANSTVFYIDTEVDNGKFSMSGSYSGGGGQCYDEIKPANDAQKELIKIWKKYHLNDLNAGTNAQSVLIDEYFKQSGEKYDYSEACEVLKSYKRVNNKPVQLISLAQRKMFDNLEQKLNELKELRKELDLVNKEFSELRKQNKTYSWIRMSDVLKKHIQVSRKNTVHDNTVKNGWFIDSLGMLEFVKKGTIKSIESLISSKDAQLDCLKMDSFLYDINPQTGKVFKYGSAWITYPLPADFETKLSNLIEKLDNTELETCPAKQFLKDTGTSFDVSFKEHDFYFDGDKDKRSIFNVTLSKNNSYYTFTFGQSIANGSNIPTEYDVLACLGHYIPNTFEDFCDEFGYSNDSISAKDTYNKCVEESDSLNEMFSKRELEKLSEIS